MEHFDQDLVRKRPSLWSYKETKLLLSVWQEEKIQKGLAEMSRNKSIWHEVGARLAEFGYIRSWNQCKLKMKTLVSRYRKVKNDNAKSGNGVQTCSFYEEIDDILGTTPLTEPNVFIESTSSMESEQADNDDLDIDDDDLDIEIEETEWQDSSSNLNLNHDESSLDAHKNTSQHPSTTTGSDGGGETSDKHKRSSDTSVLMKYFEEADKECRNFFLSLHDLMEQRDSLREEQRQRREEEMEEKRQAREDMLEAKRQVREDMLEEKRVQREEQQAEKQREHEIKVLQMLLSTFRNNQT